MHLPTLLEKSFGSIQYFTIDSNTSWLTRSPLYGGWWAYSSIGMYIPQESHDLMARGLYSAPPNAQTAMARNPALLVSWWCTTFALTLIVVRLMGRFVRTEKLFREDKIMAWAVVPLLIRMAFCHCILRWGTNNANLSNMTEQELYYRGIASRLVLPARIFYAML